MSRLTISVCDVSRWGGGGCLLSIEPCRLTNFGSLETCKHLAKSHKLTNLMRNYEYKKGMRLKFRLLVERVPHCDWLLAAAVHLQKWVFIFFCGEDDLLIG